MNLIFQPIIGFGLLFLASFYPGTSISQYLVGFKTIKHQSSAGNPWIISIWYPAATSGKKMTMYEYILCNTLEATTPDSAAIKEYRFVLNRWYGPGSITASEFSAAILQPTLASRNAEMIMGKFPLVVTHQDAAAMPQSFEYLASQGIVVASVFSKYISPEPNYDSLVYTPVTKELDEFIDYMVEQPFIDRNQVTGIGHGATIQAPFYVAMKDSKLKALINVDGGVFGPRSNTTRDPFYKPEQMKAPLLHIVTQKQNKEDDQKQFKSLNNTRYVLIIKNNEVDHLFFTSYGNLMLSLNKYKQETKAIEKTLGETRSLIVAFIKNKKLEKSIVSDVFNFSVVGANTK
jgi:hypothetical protein